MLLPPAVVIHGLDDARLVLGLGRPVTLLSAPGAASFAGCGWWRAVIRAAGTEAPDILDCAAAPGRALEAISVGCRILVLQPCPAWDSVAERAGPLGVRLLRDRPPALDVADPNDAHRLAHWLA